MPGCPQRNSARSGPTRTCVYVRPSGNVKIRVKSKMGKIDLKFKIAREIGNLGKLLYFYLPDFSETPIFNFVLGKTGQRRMVNSPHFPVSQIFRDIRNVEVHCPYFILRLSFVYHLLTYVRVEPYWSGDTYSPEGSGRGEPLQSPVGNPDENYLDGFTPGADTAPPP